MYDKIEDDAWLCPGYDELKKGKMYHSTMLTHRKGAHMQLTWQKDMACQIRLYMDEFDPKMKHEGLQRSI